MGTEHFYNEQTEITNQKLVFYKNYITDYAIKLLMSKYYKGTIFIADLFCGLGYNGERKGSPLILVDILNKLLENKTLLSRYPNPKVHLLLNDICEEKINTLKKTLNEYKVNKNINLIIKNTNFDGILKEVKSIKNYKSIPKFFFLDPFTYSSISINNLKYINSLGITEILLFSPIFDAYRFKTAKNILENKDHKTRIFIENFTFDGLVDYKDIYEFGNSILKKLRKDLKTNYVKYILLNAGSRKNALFYITNHISGSILFTKIARKLGDYGMGIDIKFKENIKYQLPLFEPENIENNTLLESFNNFLIDILKEDKLSNKSILELTTINNFTPREANDILKNNRKNLVIDYTTNKKKGFYISENTWKDEIRCFIYYKY